MLKVMIIDDERLVRDLLKACIDWAELGMTITAESGSAVEGLELVDKLIPDIIFTDICMPVMDGLEFSRKVLKKHPGIKIVILTGHDEFEYVQDSIKLGIVDFLLKPIDDVEIRETALSVKEKLLSERLQKEDYERLREQLQQNMPYLREKFLNELVQGNIALDTVTEKAAYFDITLPKDVFQIVVLELLNEEESGLTDEERRLILKMGCLEQLKSFFCNKALNVFFDSRERIVILINDGCVDVCECCESIKEMLIRSLNCSICIGIGNIHSNIDNLHISYREACDALRYRFIIGKNQVISFADICPADEEPFIDCELMDSYCFYLKSGLRNKAEELVGTVFSELRTKASSRDIVRVLSCNFIADALNVLLELGIRQVEVFKDGIQPFESIFKLDSLSEIENHIKGISSDVAQAAGKLHGKKARKLINDVREYINCSFSNPDLTLSEVARRFYINPSYLSRTFKEEIGMNFIDYLAKQRMERSIKLFHETDKKAYQIAAEVGINDPQYFSVCFKKYTGISVNDFKKGKI